MRRLLALAGIIALAGCDRIERYDSTTAAVQELRQQVLELQSQTKLQAEVIASLQADANLVADRVRALERPTKQARDESGGLSAEQISATKRVVAQCVASVRAAAPPDYDARFWKEFDAFFNQATGRVRDNVVYNGSLPAQHAFHKCMAEKGVPLS